MAQNGLIATDELPSHSHSGNIATTSLTGAFNTPRNETDWTVNGVFSKGTDSPYKGPTSGSTYYRVWINFNGSHGHTVSINATGGSKTHENRQPYEVVQRWKRTG